ncbi:MAG: homoserine dehydrogenase [Oscillospiraceae bacterium]|nr:homoserine dehydrogenase [Oscillospiraceae bacterium]
MLNIAVMGYGTVGSGVVEVFFENKELLEKRVRQPLAIKYILDLRDFPGDPHEDLLIKDFARIRDDADVQVVAEAMGGVEPAFTFTKACLEQGKSVVTSNKELVAKRGAELLEIAAAHGCNYLFEASVGGGLPVLHPLHNCLSVNHIQEIAGIFNGTTNFILTQMIEEGSTFDQALAQAQSRGFAERDPSADVDGHDACRKICIMADMAFGHQIDPDAVPVEGISGITMEDVAYANLWGGVVKLIGRAVQEVPGGPVSVRVAPYFVPGGSQLGACKGVYNAILVRGNAVEDVVFYGQGAGKRPTASAILSDILECILLGGTDPSAGWSREPGIIADPDSQITAAYYRVKGCTQTQIEKAFGSVEFLTGDGVPSGETAFVTGALPERELVTARKALEGGGAEVLGKLRVLSI